jgi:hypothetical protein
MNELPKIYIIASNEDSSSIKTKLKIKKLEKRLEKKGFEVVNPLNIYVKKKSISTIEATIYNIKQLLSCKAVYVMPEVSLKKGENLELKISLDINLIIVQGLPINL